MYKVLYFLKHNSVLVNAFLPYLSPDVSSTIANVFCSYVRIFILHQASLLALGRIQKHGKDQMIVHILFSLILDARNLKWQHLFLTTGMSD